MFSDAHLPEPKIINEIENPPDLCVIQEADGVFFDSRFTTERRIRRYIYQMLLQARLALPTGYYFKIYEAYRPLQAQIQLWNRVVAEQKKLHPDLATDSEAFIALCDVFAANPYRQGSGHQSGAAIDVSLCDAEGKEYDMGGQVRGFGASADFEYPVSETARHHRFILRTALENVGFVNYPAEWWHYSFGDRLWARLTGSKIAVFSQLDL